MDIIDPRTQSSRTVAASSAGPSSATRRGHRRGVLAGLVLALGPLWLASTPAGAAELPGGGVHYPVDSEWNATYTDVERFIADEDWISASEGLLALYKQLETKRGLDLSGSWSSVVPSGAGFALGLGPACTRLFKRLPPEERRRFVAAIEPVLADLLSHTLERTASVERARLRHLILRDYGWSRIGARIAREELDASLLRGDLDSVRQLAESLAASEGAPAALRLRTQWILFQTAEADGDALAWRESRDALRRLVTELGGELEPALRRRLEDALAAAGPARARDSEPAASPLALAITRLDDGERRYELGSAKARRPFEHGELRSHLDARIPPTPPVVSPALTGASPSTAIARRRESADFPLPFFATARGDTLFLQTYYQVAAWSIPELEPRWSTLVGDGGSETLESQRAPAIGPGLVVVNANDTLVCLESSTGRILWKRRFTYERAAKRLVVSDGDVPLDVAAPGATADGTDPDESADEGAGDPADDPAAGPPGDDAERRSGRVSTTLTPAASHLDDFLVGVTARVDGEILAYVAAVGADGETSWIAYTGSSSGSDHLGLGSTLSVPLVRDGKAFLLTNLGYVAALDADDGHILWLNAYRKLSDGGKIRAIDSWERWQPNPILSWHGELVIAPQDADSLVSFDAESGRLLWQLPRERHTTLLGATETACILGGPSIRAIELADPAHRGSTLWRWTPSRAPLVAVGRATVRGDSVFVSDMNALYTLDVATGALRSTALWDFRGGGGNLTVLDDGLLAVASVGGYLIYNHLESELARLASLPAGSQERLLESGKLQLKSGDVDTALETLGEWERRRFPEPQPNSNIDRLLFELSEALRYTVDLTGDDDARAADLLRVLSRTEVLPEFAAIAAFRGAQASIERGQLQEAVDLVRGALERGLGETPCSVNHFLAVPGRIVAESLLEQIRQRGDRGRAAFTYFEWDAQEALARARQQGTQTAFEKVVASYPLTRACALAHLELARYFQDQQNLNESVRWLLDYLRSYPAATDYTEVTLRAVNQLTQLGSYTEARDLLRTLANQRPDETPPQGLGLGETVRAYVERRLREPGFREVRVPMEGRWLRFPLRLDWRSPANLLTTRREFLATEGYVPPALAGHFMTFSNDLIECRSTSTGLARWTVEFAMVPSFVQSRYYSSFDSSPRAYFMGDRLVFRDRNNLLCVDALAGTQLWSRTFDDAEQGSRERLEEPFRVALNEQVLGLGVGADRVVARTSRNRLVCIGADGEEVFAVSLSSRNTRYKGDPVVVGDRVAVFRQAPLEVVSVDAQTGEELEVLSIPESNATIKDIVSLDRHRSAMMTTRELVFVDLRRREVLSRYALEDGILEGVWDFPAYRGQVVVHSVHQKRRRLAGVSIADGKELWRYEKFEEQRYSTAIRPSVYADETRLYVLYGSETRYLAGVDVRPGPDPDGYTAIGMWAPDIDLGLKFGRQLELLVTHDSIIFPDPVSNTLAVYEKTHGTDRRALSAPVHAFLVDKKSGFQCRVQDGMLLVLTDRGDAGFAPLPSRLDLTADREKVDRLRRYLQEPTDWDNVAWLALAFFREANTDAAQEILGQALMSENLPSLDSPGKYQELRFLLDGIKEEAMKERRPEDLIVARRFRTPPLIDGELNEGWNVTRRRELSDLRSVNLIPTVGQESDVWKGAEDLSGTLYTGWDEDYFYFALDVEDNRIYPYDKEAKFWKGDCLIIGLDPEGDGGLYQSKNDQLLTLALTIPNRKPKQDEEDQEGEDGEEDEARKPKGQYSVKKKDDNGGVIYEAAIPWETFGQPISTAGPYPDMEFGLSLVVTDDDTGQGATKMLSLKPCHLIPRDQASRSIWKHLVPHYFPRVVLE